VPASVEAAARQRSEARAERDWDTADRLKAEIEAAGWRVIDAGVKYRLRPASPPNVEVGAEIRYGRSDAVPSRLEEPPAGLATVILVASEDAGATAGSLDALDSAVPDGVDIVVVADAVRFDEPTNHEVVRTSARLGRAAALNIGIRRARAAVVVLLEASLAPTGDMVTPLVEALGDPEVAIAGPVGLTSPDLRVFEEAIPTDDVLEVTAIRGGLMGFRREDVAGLGAIDEAFRSGAYLDVWLSLLLRDTGEGSTPRRAIAVPGLPIRGSVAASSVRTGAAPRGRDARRGFYRMLDRFRAREDLAVPKRVVRSGTDS